jgi:hypothetical protein
MIRCRLAGVTPLHAVQRERHSTVITDNNKKMRTGLVRFEKHTAACEPAAAEPSSCGSRAKLKWPLAMQRGKWLGVRLVCVSACIMDIAQ